jgi:Flp pilus assembly protein TadG
MLKAPRDIGRRGAVAVELALVLPLMVVLLAGIWEIGRMVDAHQVLRNACREAGRQAGTGRKTIADVQQVVFDYLERAGISTAGMPDPIIENITAPARSDPTDADQLDRIRVSATLPLANFSWSPVHLFTTSGSTLTVSVDWYSMRDSEMQIVTDIPVM